MPSLEERIYLVKSELEQAGFIVKIAPSNSINITLTNRMVHIQEIEVLDLPIRTYQSSQGVVAVVL